MLHRDSPFRLLVTVLLAVAVPFCCCNFHSLLSSCVPCEAATHHDAAKPVADHHSDGAVHDHDSDHHSGPTTAHNDGSEPGQSPCGPGHDDDDCTCGKQNTLLTIAKQTVEFPSPVLVAILSFPTIAESWALCPFSAMDRGLWTAVRPPTTLLRLHCALIV